MRQISENVPAPWRNLFLTLILVLSGLGLSGASSAQEIAEQFREEAQKIYVAYYGRPGDPAGVAFWSQQLADNDGDLSAVVNAFGTSEEFEQRYQGLDNETLVNNIYLNILNRGADPSGLAFYVDGLNSGRLTLATIALDIANGI